MHAQIFSSGPTSQSVAPKPYLHLGFDPPATRHTAAVTTPSRRAGPLPPLLEGRASSGLGGAARAQVGGSTGRRHLVTRGARELWSGRGNASSDRISPSDAAPPTLNTRLHPHA